MVSPKHGRVLGAIFARPTRAGIRWSDVENMIKAHGGTMQERAGSRVLIRYNNRRAVFHRPHPGPHIDKGAVDALRRFLTEADLTP